MKLLIDPIYTTCPRRCASTVKMVRTVQHLADKNPDLYLYWVRPQNDQKLWSEADEAWLKVELGDMYDRTLFVAVNCTDDRYKGYTTLRQDLEYVYAFDGNCWDWDVLITNRSALVPLIRMISLKNGRNGMAWSRRIALYEDMPMMSFKKHLAHSHLHAWDAQTLLGYTLADKVAICAFWEKAHIVSAAKKHLSASNARRVIENVVETSPVKVEGVSFKSREFVAAQQNHDMKFTISFSGRIVMGQRLEEIFEIMQNHWVYRSGKEGRIKCVMTTASKGLAGRVSKVLSQVPEMVDFEPADRDRFWQVVKDESSVGVYLSTEEDYSMSVMEPLMMGLPIALYKAEWTIASVGPEYPFFVRSAKEAYGVIRAFYEDYAGEYAKFVAWSRKYLEPLLLERNKVWTPYTAEACVAQYQDSFDSRKARMGESARSNEVVQLIAQHTEPGEVIDVKGKVQELEDRGLLRDFAKKASAMQRENFRLPFSTDWNTYRLGLKTGYDFVDGGPLPGTLKRG